MRTKIIKRFMEPRTNHDRVDDRPFNSGANNSLDANCFNRSRDTEHDAVHDSRNDDDYRGT